MDPYLAGIKEHYALDCDIANEGFVHNKSLKFLYRASMPQQTKTSSRFFSKCTLSGSLKTIYQMKELDTS